MPSSNLFAPSASLEANRNQSPSAQASPPSITLSSPPSQPGLDSTDLEEPPPYTPSASVTSGETTIEVGPSRPFQSTRPSTNPQQNGASQVSHGRIVSSPSFPSPSSSLPLRQRPASAVQHLSDSFPDIVNHLSTSVTNTLQSLSNNLSPRSTTPSWSSYPGQNSRAVPSPLPNPNRNTHNLVPPPVPPRHPQSPSAPLHPPPLSTSTHSLPSMNSHSDFARDFYAAGSGSGENLITDTAFAPPAGPPPSTRQASAAQSVPNDGRPTSQPQPGHPLLKDGNLLVYTKGFECRKCSCLLSPLNFYLIILNILGHNMGYKDGNPKNPCNQCWKKYAKPFSGPLVYSFPADSASSSLASNFQKPLPHTLPSSPSVASSSASQPTRLTRNSPGRRDVVSSPAPMRVRPPVSPPPPASVAPPPPRSVTYRAGDPRIGGTLCWKCGGQGSFELFIFRETCPLCSGVGRVFCTSFLLC